MSFRINTNVSAMTALNSLNRTSEAMAIATQRLSTGLRINSAADDPAGLIQAKSYQSQITGLTTAIGNNQAALNYAKTAEGGLDEVNTLLNTARSLAIANGNASLDANSKAANQSQLNAILQSIDRISRSTQFGTKNLLDGSSGVTASIANTAVVQTANFTGTFAGVSVTSGGTVDINVTTAATQGTVAGTKTIATGATTVGAGSFTLNGQTFTTTASTTRDQLVAQLNSSSAQTGVTASVNGTNKIVLTSNTYGTTSTVNLDDASGIILSAAGVATGTGVNAVANVTFGGQTVIFNQGNGLNLKDTDGNTIGLTTSGNATGTTTAALSVTAGSAQFQVGANAGQRVTLSLGSFSSSSLGLTGLDISGATQDAAINTIDAAISQVSSSRGQIGSFMTNTVQSNIRSLGVAQENMSATLSNIQDVDVASEMTNYTKLQILSQSGISMLTQANSSPQQILSLLRG